MIESDGALPSAPVQTIAEIPRRYAESNPDAIAVSFEGRDKLPGPGRIIQSIANGLVAAGVRSASRIAILDKNSDIFFQILLGAAKARAVLVPINQGWRLLRLLSQSTTPKPRVLFVGEEFVEIISTNPRPAGHRSPNNRAELSLPQVARCPTPVGPGLTSQPG